MLYLVRYPFECNEQIASRMLAIAALKDVLGAFKAEGLPPKAALVATVSADLTKLAQRQHYSGGWDWWRKDRQPDPFVSVHVTHALVMAKEKGFRVPDELRDGRVQLPAQHPLPVPALVPGARTPHGARLRALRTRPRRPERRGARPRRSSPRARASQGTSMDALGWLLPILSKIPRRHRGRRRASASYLDNKVAETAGKAHFVTGVSDQAHVTLESDRRTDGILLSGMIADRPESDVIPKIAQGLLAHRKRGHWYNTQENVFVLLALDRYFATYEKATPDFVARAWLGDRLAAEHPFKGRSRRSPGRSRSRSPTSRARRAAATWSWPRTARGASTTASAWTTCPRICGRRRFEAGFCGEPALRRRRQGRRRATAIATARGA